MQHITRLFILVALLAATFSCGGASSEDDGPSSSATMNNSAADAADSGGEGDVGADALSDAGAMDVQFDATEDAAEDVSDTDGSPEDAATDDVEPDVGGVVGDGFGELEGECGVLAEELGSASPSLFRNSIDFEDDPYDDADASLLTEGGRTIIADGNAGGSSILSEVFAFEVLARCEGAALLKTENDIEYDAEGKITDLLVEIDAMKVGVSVTRAVGFPREDPYTVDRARMLLEDKLGDVLLSSANVSAEDAWVKQILHVIAFAPMHADSLEQAFDQIDPSITADTIVVVTVSEGVDDFLY